jgi:hypothetical protein
MSEFVGEAENICSHGALLGLTICDILALMRPF